MLHSRSGVVWLSDGAFVLYFEWKYLKNNFVGILTVLSKVKCPAINSDFPFFWRGLAPQTSVIASVVIKLWGETETVSLFYSLAAHHEQSLRLTSCYSILTIQNSLILTETIQTFQTGKSSLYILSSKYTLPLWPQISIRDSLSFPFILTFSRSIKFAKFLFFFCLLMGKTMHFLNILNVIWCMEHHDQMNTKRWSKLISDGKTLELLWV